VPIPSVDPAFPLPAKVETSPDGVIFLILLLTKSAVYIFVLFKISIRSFISLVKYGKLIVNLLIYFRFFPSGNLKIAQLIFANCSPCLVSP
jgi:hypothetical protein